MRKRTAFLPLLLLSGAVLADTVSRDEARWVATAYLAQHGRTVEASSTPYRAPRRGRASAEEAAYYVFNAGEDRGFVIVSGDDRTPQVLGYADEGSFDAGNMPDNMRSFLQLYADEIAALDASDASETAQPTYKGQATRHSVPALLKSRWNQGSPYNNSCPDYYKGDGSAARPAAGCTATAFAQLVNFFKYPDALAGSIPAHSCSYTLNDKTTKTSSMAAVPAGTKIDWENMCDVYTGGESAAQKKAVADLVAYCGQAVKMSYGASSGASASGIPSHLKSIFGFDSSARYVYRSNYDLQEWEDLLYDEVSEGYPVLFCGWSTGGGHAFIIDGYDGQGLFHVNWGWGGSSDGWYVITSLAPGKDVGDGASSTSDGYAMGQACVVSVRVPDGLKREPASALSVSDMSCADQSITATFKNGTGSTNSFVAGIVYFDDGEQAYVPVGTAQSLVGMANDDSRTFTYNLRRRLTEGVYRLVPASRYSTSNVWHPAFSPERECILATVDASKNITLEHLTRTTRIEMDTIIFPGNRVVNQSQPVRVVFRNLADEFQGLMRLYAGKDGAKTDTKSRTNVSVPKDGTGEASFSFKPTSTGTYTIYVCSDNGSKVYAQTTVDIVSSNANAASLRVSNIAIANSSGGTIYGNRLYGTLSVENKAATRFEGQVQIRLWSQPKNSSTATASTAQNVSLAIDPGKVGVAVFRFDNLSFSPYWHVVVNYVNQDGSLDNGALWNASHRYTLTPGVMAWSVQGVLSCSAAPPTALTVSSTAAGLYLKNVSISRLTANLNPNTVYAISSADAQPAINSRTDNTNLVVGSWADSIAFQPGYAYYNPLDYTARKASFSYTVPEAVDGRAAWDAVLMPFVPERVTVDGREYPLLDKDAPFCLYEFVLTDRSGLPVFRPATRLYGNIPYLIAANPALSGRDIVFEADSAAFYQTGSVNQIVAAETFTWYATSLQTSVAGAYHLNSDGTAFVYRESSRTVKPFQTYFLTTIPDDVRPSSIPLPEVPEKIATGISLAPSPSPGRGEPGAIYDLSGRRVEKAQRGIYIVNGKKIFIQ